MSAASGEGAGQGGPECLPLGALGGRAVGVHLGALDLPGSRNRVHKPLQQMGSPLPSLQCRWRTGALVLGVAGVRELQARAGLVTSVERGRLHDILAGLVSQGSLEISADAPGLHPIMWPPRLRLCPSSCFGLCCPASAPGAPGRRLLSAQSRLPLPGHLPPTPRLAPQGDGVSSRPGPTLRDAPRLLDPALTAQAPWCCGPPG